MASYIIEAEAWIVKYESSIFLLVKQIAKRALLL